MHYFVPKRCLTTNKIMYRDKVKAQQAAAQSLQERGIQLWVYRCDDCGTWHLTHRGPDMGFARMPAGRQFKPHSRKKGFKPRQR